MKKIFIIFCLFVCSALSANAFGMQSTMDRLMDSWVGENIDSVIDKWGYPSNSKDIAGRKLYCWESSQIIVTSYSYGVYGGQATCNKTFEVDDNNVIKKWQWEGNSCPATYHGVKKYLNPKNNYWKDKKSAKRK